MLELVVALRLEWVTVGGCEAVRAMKTGVGVTNEYPVGFTLVIFRLIRQNAPLDR